MKGGGERGEIRGGERLREGRVGEGGESRGEWEREEHEVCGGI